MRPALITLSKKILLNNETEERYLKDIFHAAKNHLLSAFTSTGMKLANMRKNDETWVPRIDQDFNENNRYIKNIKADFPNVLIGNPTSPIKVNSGSIETINGIKDDEKSFQFNLHIALEPVTVLDKIGDSLLIAIGNKSKEYNEEKQIETILLPIGDEYRIKTYQKI
jgi:hypothetical protein